MGKARAISILRQAGRTFLFLLTATTCVIGTASPSGALNGTEVYFTTRSVDIYQNPEIASQPFGRLFVATRLAVQEYKTGWLRVEVRGWHQKGAERVIYALPGKRILTAALSPAVVDRLRPLDTMNDPETSISWNEASFKGWIRDEAVTANLNTIWKSAWDLFATRCTVCHQRRIPHKYTANQWVGLLKVMGPRTGLPKEKQRLILTYLQNHAKDTVGDPSATKP